MAQHDYSIANASGAAVRSDLNSALSAIVSLNSGATAPTTTFAHMLWADTTTGLLKLRNAGNTDWVSLGTMASTNLGNSRLVQATAVTATSGTFVDFTGIPSWAKKIMIMLNGVSTSGTSRLVYRLGISSGVEATGYTSTTFEYDTGTTTQDTTAIAAHQTLAAADTHYGMLTIVNLTGNVWVANGTIGESSNAPAVCVGAKTLGGVLDRVRVTTTGGTDTFDAGSINIIYEG